MEFKEITQMVVHYLKGMWRYRWIGLLMAFVLAVVGWVCVAMIPDYYRAHSKVYIDTQTLLMPLMKDIAVTLDPDMRIRKMSRMLLSRPNLERIAHMSDLDLDYFSRTEKENFINTLEQTIKFRQSGHTNMYEITYDHPEPRTSKLVVHSIINLFRELTLSDTRTDSVVAQQFIGEQIEHYRTKLVEAEQRLADFKRTNIDHLPKQDQTYYEHLQQLLGQLEQIHMQITIMQSRQQALEKELRGELPIFGLSQNERRQTIHPLMRELREAENKVERLQQYYTEHHPDVILLNQEVTLLKNKIEKEQDSYSWVINDEELNKNPVYQQIKIQLSEVNSEIAALQAHEQEIKRLASEIETKVDDMIDAEAKLADLNRDYLINKSQFNALLEKREFAKLAENIDDTAENIKFKIIDPPYVDSVPVWPKRGLFNLAVLMGAIGGGLVTTWSMAQLRPVYYHRVMIEKMVQIPVLVTLGCQRTPQELKGQRLNHTYFVAGILSLIALSLMIYVLTGAKEVIL